MTRFLRVVAGIVALAAVAAAAGAQQPALTKDEARAALRKAVDFYRGKVAVHGGYVYRYSADLQKREGEGKTGVDTVWVQPPGTPAVGLAYVEAYERTGEQYLLDAAKEAGECLIRGQLRSGGWNDRIEFGAERAKFEYRVEPAAKKARFNVSTFDDDKTQAAIRFLMRLDKALGFKDQRVHEAVRFALDSVVAAQFPNGAWPQGWDKPADPALSVKRAEVPKEWPRAHPGGKYWFLYTFNDNSVADTIETLLLASRVYREEKYRAAALKAGDFILLAQLPEPQPAWAQQYDYEMRPAWARKFEPPAVSGGESQNLLVTLMDLYVESGERKYLEAVPKATGYLKRSRLADGQLARFYELSTNRPLYFTKAYALTYDDMDVPTHYAFKVGSRLDSIEAQYKKLAGTPLDEVRAERQGRAWKGDPAEAGRVVAAMDGRGAWVEEGKLKYHGKADETTRVIQSGTFARNVGVLSRFAAEK